MGAEITREMENFHPVSRYLEGTDEQGAKTRNIHWERTDLVTHCNASLYPGVYKMDGSFIWSKPLTSRFFQFNISKYRTKNCANLHLRGLRWSWFYSKEGLQNHHLYDKTTPSADQTSH